MSNKFKNFFLPLIFIFLLSVGIKEISFFYEVGHLERTLLVLSFGYGVFGVALIYLSYKLFKSEDWRMLIMPFIILLIAFSLQHFIIPFFYFVYESPKDYPWVTEWHHLGTFVQIILSILIGILAFSLAYKVNKLKKVEKLDLKEMATGLSLIFLFYGFAVILTEVFIFSIEYINQPYWYEGMEFRDWDLICIMFGVLCVLSIILFSIHLFKKRIDLVKIPLIGFFTFYGLTELSSTGGIIPFDILSFLSFIVGIVSIVLAYVFLNLNIKEIKEILKERYKIA